MRAFSNEELHAQDPLLPPKFEDDALQRDIGGTMARCLMTQFNIDDSRFDDVANAVFECLGEIGFSASFREMCCIKPDAIRPDIYDELRPLNNEERMDLIFKRLGFGGLDEFLQKNMPYFEKALIQAGFDIQASKAARRLLKEVI